MKSYLVKLSPQEPYFFGNEKTFKFEKEDNQGQMGNSYFIRSERTPLQTTLVGMMRYILMPYKDFRHHEENAPVIGRESFRITAENQSFGVIKKISPLFIMKDSDKYVVTPFDCISKINNKFTKIYTPFTKYTEINTDSGKKRYAEEFDVKAGIADSYVRLSDRTLVQACEIFGTETRVGIKKVMKGKNEKAFFKKEYCYLKDDFIFAFYVELDDSAILPENMKTEVTIGQGKSLFTVEFVEQKNTNDTIRKEVSKILPDGISYCLSDVFVNSEIYNCCEFAVTDTRDYRAYETTKEGKVRKDSTLWKLIKAGSVFIVSALVKFSELTESANCKTAGFNNIVDNQEGK